MPAQSTIAKAKLLVGGTLLLAIVAGAIAMLRMDIWGQPRSDRPGGRGSRRAAQRPRNEDIDPALIRYEQTGHIAVGMKEVRAVATGPDGRIYVAGDKMVRVFDSGGQKHSEIPLDAEPNCLAVGNREHAFPGRVYVGMSDHVEVFDVGGTPVGTWKTPSGKAGRARLLPSRSAAKPLFTSIAAHEEDVFTADAGNLIVWRYDLAGNLKGRIGDRSEARQVPGYLVSSPHFDLAVASDACSAW